MSAAPMTPSAEDGFVWRLPAQAAAKLMGERLRAEQSNRLLQLEAQKLSDKARTALTQSCMSALLDRESAISFQLCRWPLAWS